MSAYCSGCNQSIHAETEAEVAREMVADLLAEQHRLRAIVLRQWSMAHATRGAEGTRMSAAVHHLRVIDTGDDKKRGAA